jgi:hypothetical protein
MHADFWKDTACYSHFEPINRQGAEDEKAFVPCSFRPLTHSFIFGFVRGVEASLDDHFSRIAKELCWHANRVMFVNA